MRSIRVLLTDDYAPWRRHVRTMLEARPQLEVVGEASSGSEAIEKAKDLKPDVVFLDISLPDLNGFEVTLRIFEDAPQSKVIILSQQIDEDLVRAALGAGASGFLLKTAPPADIVSAVEAAMAGKTYVYAGQSVVHS